ncbi:hypothetical protein AURDEDRAFT_114017 [Auricularia subglabra TFB-10046 SS5]|nr:hypothetical protein AURDEDRAFT_114017 [Auricularia subglabra TFB-10046 SS5]
MSALHTQYLLHPIAPLISDPGACGFLALPALKNNLAEHAKYNAEIPVKGSKAELCEALRAVLERRRRDMMVRAVLWQQDGDETARSGMLIDEMEEGEQTEQEGEGTEDLYKYA